MTPPRVPADVTEIVRPAATALVVWDMQVGNAGHAHNLPALQRDVRSLLDAARSSGTMVIWSRHVAPELDHTTPAGLWTLMRRQGVSDPALVKAAMQRDSPEVEFLPGLAPQRGELVLEKSTASFFVGTPVEIYLRALAITSRVMVGVATDLGIDLTARHALALGLFAVVVEGAVGSFTEAAHDLGLARLRTTALVVPTTEILKAWKAGPTQLPA